MLLSRPRTAVRPFLSSVYQGMRSLLLYLALVGLPLAGLFGILRAGSRLEAPPAVGGAWRVEAPASPADSVLEVSQSGVHAVVRHGGVRMRGEVRGDSLFAAAGHTWHTPPAAVCGPAFGRELRARVDRAAEPDRMEGTVIVPGKPECPAAMISAVHVPKPARGGGH